MIKFKLSGLLTIAVVLNSCGIFNISNQDATLLKEYIDPYLSKLKPENIQINYDEFFLPKKILPSENKSYFVDENGDVIGLGLIKNKKSFKTSSIIMNKKDFSVHSFKKNIKELPSIVDMRHGNCYPENLCKDWDKKLYNFSDIPILDQGGRGTCTSMALASLIDYTNKIGSRGYTGDARISPQYISWMLQETLYQYPENAGMVTNPNSEIPLISEGANLSIAVSLAAENSDFQDNIIPKQIFNDGPSKKIYSNTGLLNIKYMDSNKHFEKDHELFYTKTSSQVKLMKPIDRAKSLLGNKAKNLLDSILPVIKTRSYPVLNTIYNFKHLLSQGKPIIMSIDVHDKYRYQDLDGSPITISTEFKDRWKSKDGIIYEQPVDLLQDKKVTGSHCILLVGYIDLKENESLFFNEKEISTSQQIDYLNTNEIKLRSQWTKIREEYSGYFIIRNSWGEKSHKGGYALIPYGWIEQTGSEAYYALPSISTNNTSYLGWIFQDGLAGDVGVKVK